MRINNQGQYKFCRWADDDAGLVADIQHTAPGEFFQKHMSALRHGLLQGHAPSACGSCHLMEQHGKVSGRQRQLLKIGVDTDHFVETMQSSPWYQELEHSDRHQGHTQQMPQDWQIDLGNHCNSACVMCQPNYSSRLATELHGLGMLQQIPANSWCQDPILLDRFVDALKQSPRIQYLHFLGGETLITPAFRRILEALIQCGLNETASIGFTTNLTVWDDSINDLLVQFREVNLGVSIETMDRVNDYVRWPSDIISVKQTLDRWVAFGQQHGWLIQIRPTPSVLTVAHMLPLWNYALNHGLAIESCNFIHRPDFMRPSVLPPQYRQTVIQQIDQWLESKDLGQRQVINTRDPNQNLHQVTQDLMSYRRYLEHQPDDSHRLPELIQYLKRLQSGRRNCVLEYLPEYEELFRSNGY